MILIRLLNFYVKSNSAGKHIELCIDSRCGASFSYVVRTLDLLCWFLKRNVFSLLLVLILLSYSFTLLFSCDEPLIETTLRFAHQIQG